MTFHDFAIQNKFVLTKEDVPNVHYINGQTEIRFQVWMSAQDNAATPPAAADDVVKAAVEWRKSYGAMQGTKDKAHYENVQALIAAVDALAAVDAAGKP